MNAVIAGATGMIGTAVSAAMIEAGHSVTGLVRSQSGAARLPAGVSCLEMPGDGAWKSRIASADVVINLAGESIGGARWTPAFKEKLVQSRVSVTQSIVDAMLENHKRDRAAAVLINASAVGYYGDCGDEIVTEEHAHGADFLAQLCVKWEAEAARAETIGARVVIVRLGHVLAPNGLLKALLYPWPVKISPLKIGLGGPLGSGRQWWPWVHIADAARLILQAADDDRMRGAINAASPQPVTNRTFMGAVGHLLGRPAILPVPGFVLRAMLGEFADAILGGQRVLPQKALAAGFTFQYAELDGALRSALSSAG